MNSIFKILANKEDTWFTKNIGEPNGNPVNIRVMNNYIAPFHTHENSDEMFIVISGTLFIDMTKHNIELNEGESYTVSAGVEHRARVEGRAELIVIGGKSV